MMRKSTRAEISTSSLFLPSGTVEYSLVPPHDQVDFVTTTRSGTVGVSFSAHRRAVREIRSGPVTEGDIAPGSAFLTMSNDLVWLRIQEPTEALEIDFDPALIRSVAEELGASRPVALPDVGPQGNLVIWAAAAVFRRAVLCQGAMEELEATSRLRLLTAHILRRYGGVLGRPRHKGLLDQRRLQRVDDVIQSGLADPLPLERLAAAAALSPFHLLRSFRRTTGLTPHAYVAARRMDQAMRLLKRPDLTISEIAHQVGYTNVSHFRRVFHAHWGTGSDLSRLHGARVR